MKNFEDLNKFDTIKEEFIKANMFENNVNRYADIIKEHQSEFEVYYKTLVEYNEKVNLTAITEREEVFVKHFLDSILPIAEIKQNSSMVDVGTGAGFPSLPLKIVRPDLKLTMVDSLQKRVDFLNFLIEKLNYKPDQNPQLDKIKVDNTKNFDKQTLNTVHSRAEDFAKNNREKFDVAVARAVARLNTLLEYLLPLVKVGGIVLAYKGSNFEEELTESKNALSVLGGKYVKTLHFDLPNNAGERNIIVIKKIKQTPTIYPRGQNKPKTNPLV